MKGSFFGVTKVLPVAMRVALKLVLLSLQSSRQFKSNGALPPPFLYHFMFFSFLGLRRFLTPHFLQLQIL